MNEDRARGLAKAARVILDECVVSGLQHDYDLRYEYDIQADGYFDEEFRPIVARDPRTSATVKMEIGASEAPIPWDAVMALDPKGSA